MQTQSPLDKIILKVREKANKYPNNTYSNPEGSSMCSFTKGKNSECPIDGCIFGSILIELNIDFLDTESIGSALNRSKITNYKMQQLHWITEVQCRQDDGKTWAEAIRYADEIFGEQ